MNLSYERCREILTKYRLGEDALLHTLAVTDVALHLGQRLCERGEHVDLGLLRAACLLHDVGKGSLAIELYPGIDHATAAARISMSEGLPEIVAPVQKHMLDAAVPGTAALMTWEEKLLWYADKSTSYRYIGIDRRFSDLLFRYSDHAHVISSRLDDARALEATVFATAGYPVGYDLAREVARRPAGYLATSIGTTYDYSVEIGQMLSDVAQAGFDSVSFAGGNVAHSGYDSPSGRERLLAICAGHALRIGSLHAPFWHDMSSPDENERAQAIDGAVTACEAAAALGSSVVVVHPHAWLPEGATRERCALASESVGQILRRAPAGVRLAVENLPPLGTEKILAAILATYSREKVGFCYDSSHDVLQPREYDVLEAFGDRLIAVHISDNLGQNDDHMIPGEGAIDWTAFASRFGTLDYSGDFLLEVETRMSRLKQSQAFLNWANNRAQWLLGLSNRLGDLSR